MSHIDTLKTMKQQLMSCTEAQLSDISKVDSRELGDAIDMIKDLSQAIYYCTITESMEKSEQDKPKGDTNINYYTTPDWNKGNINYYTEMPNITRRDPREGRSPMHRRMYMEGKEPKEIAETLGKSPKTVYNALVRLKRKIRDLFR